MITRNSLNAPKSEMEPQDSRSVFACAPMPTPALSCGLSIDTCRAPRPTVLQYLHVVCTKRPDDPIPIKPTGIYGRQKKK